MIASLSLRAKVALAVAGLLVVAAAAPFVYGYVAKYLQVGLGSGDDPYGYATVVHKQLPESTVPDEWAAIAMDVADSFTRELLDDRLKTALKLLSLVIVIWWMSSRARRSDGAIE